MKKKHSLLAAIAKTGSGTIAALFFWVLSSKLIAYYLGPTGIGLFSLIKQAITTLSFFGVAGQTAVVQGISTRQNKDREDYIRSTFWIYILGTICSASLTLVAYQYISTNYFSWRLPISTHVILLTGLPVIAGNLYYFFKSVINGHRAIGRLAIVELSGPLTTLVAIYPICLYFKGNLGIAFLMTILGSQLVMLGMALFFLYSVNHLPTISLRPSRFIDNNHARGFLKIAGFTILSTLVSTISLFLVRAYITNHAGLEAAGFFDLAWTVSGAYVMILLGAFGTYYLPTLAAENDVENRAALITKVFRLSVVFSTFLITSVIATKSLLVTFLYTNEFAPALDLVRWMLIGDYLKITAWVFAIPSIARGDMLVYFKTESVWWISFVTLSIACISITNSFEFVALFFALLYIPLLLYYFNHIRQDHLLHLSKKDWLLWLVGFLDVLIASLITWSQHEFSISLSLTIICFVTCSLFIVINDREKIAIAALLKRLIGKSHIQ